MSLRSPLAYTIPAETIRVAQAAFPKGTLYMQMADAFGMLYTNQEFAALFATTGQPALDPARLALVLVMQFAEGLSDLQAADAVRGRIDWKYALALDLTDPGFDAAVLSKFRDRLVGSNAEILLLDTLLTLLHERGLLKARGTQRTDSTMVLAAIRTLNRLELVGETLRLTLNRLAEIAPDWLRMHLDPAWVERYAVRVDSFRLPKSQSARQALAATIGADGFALLDAIDGPDTPRQVQTDPAVHLLWRIWIQQYYGPGDPPCWRKDGDVPPAPRLIHSPHDVDARYSIKRGTSWIGYKVHLTESCDRDLPRLITHVETTPATTPDDQQLPAIHAILAAKGLLPRAHVVDAGYTSSETLVHSQRDYGVQIIGPVAHDPSWQAREKTGFGNDAFHIDWERQRATCPQGHESRKWHPERDIAGQEVIQIRFAQKACGSCPVRAQCTRARYQPRTVTIRTEVYHTALQAARQQQTTHAFKEAYAIRAGIESSISQGVRRSVLRRTRYIGQAKTQLQQILVAVALNVVRSVAWVHDHTRPESLRAIAHQRPKHGRFATLMAAG
jgi:transposase